jgi:choline monooxygenase
VFDKAVLHECNYNWKTFIEVYLEDYHVGPFHPGLGSFVTCDDLRWEFGPEHSVQTVGVNDALRKAGSPAYQRWHEAGAEVPRRPAAGKHGAIWLTYYPTVMVEWYPHVLVVSTLFPRAAQDAQPGGVLLPRGDRRLRARVHRGRAGRLHGDLHRGRRDRRAWTPAAWR